MHTDHLEEMAVDEAAEDEAVGLDVLGGHAEVDGDVVFLLEDEDGEAVIGAALLGVGGDPGEEELGGRGKLGEVDDALGGVDGDVGGEEVAAVVVAVFVEVGHV